MMLEAILSLQAVLFLKWFVALAVLTSPALFSLGMLLWLKRKGLVNY